ncbi:MAG: signal peptidase I [Alphaproteobacteria bacterium]|jgi:signal peptidase I|nr:signal peptidase I [Alphaproteobacteria bacterium]
MTEKLENTDGKLDEKPRSPPLNAREELGEFFRTAVIAVILALLIRSFLYEPFNIPSGSMKPTLEIGDYLFVNKPAYGYSRYSFPFGIIPISGRIWAAEPERGDVIVFKLPSNTHVDYIKRVIGLPGDKIQVRSGRLYINNELVPREPVGMVKDEEFVGGPTVAMVEYLETLPGGVIHRIYEESDDEILDDTEIYEVPDGHYFMMGDNRDNSQDSRVTGLVGFVPLENVVGEADFIFFSTNGYARIFEFWKWPWTMRYERFFKSIEPVRPEGKGDAENAS